MEENFASLSSDTWIGSLRNAYLWLDTVAFSVYILSEFLFFLSDLLYLPNYSWGIQHGKSYLTFSIKEFRTIWIIDIHPQNYDIRYYLDSFLRLANHHCVSLDTNDFNMGNVTNESCEDVELSPE